ncbi:MAG: ABC transporter ATP-binding protein, partial [Malacoplasma sp.]
RGVAGLDDDARGLSGGNQQKLIVGREIIKNNKFIIFSQPTRGLDVGAIEYIHSRILELKKEKKAILLISYELDEILNLADTIAVINKYQFIGCGDKKDMTRSKIGMLIANQGKGV